jgi:hypothetical protein
MADEWIGIVNTTRARYMKGASDLTIRKRLLLAMLRKRGRFEYNCSGDELKWQVEFSQPPVSAHADGGVVDFANHDAFRQLVIDWRGYIATDSMSKKQTGMNKGDEALIKLFNTKQERLRKSIDNNFSGELYRDGSAAGRENNIHGLETFMGAGTVTATDRIAAPSDTYGNTALSTALAAYGGSWSSDLTTKPNASLATDWPDGQGDVEYDFNSPKLINWSASNWGTSATTWEANAWRVISQAITWLTTTGGEDGMPSLIAMAPNMFQGYKNAQEVKTRINIPHKESQDLGFGNTLNQDGCGLYPDFDCPVDTAYCLNLAMMTVCSLFDELFWMEGPDKDPRTGWGYLWGTGFYGNVRYESPKHFGKIKNFA